MDYTRFDHRIDELIEWVSASSEEELEFDVMLLRRAELVVL